MSAPLPQAAPDPGAAAALALAAELGRAVADGDWECARTLESRLAGLLRRLCAGCEGAAAGERAALAEALREARFVYEQCLARLGAERSWLRRELAERRQGHRGATAYLAVADAAR